MCPNSHIKKISSWTINKCGLKIINKYGEECDVCVIDSSVMACEGHSLCWQRPECQASHDAPFTGDGTDANGCPHYSLSQNRSDITQQAPGQRQHIGQTQTLPVILERMSVVNQICQSQHLCCLFIGFTVISQDRLWVVFCLNTLKIGSSRGALTGCQRFRLSGLIWFVYYTCKWFV